MNDNEFWARACLCAAGVLISLVLAGGSCEAKYEAQKSDRIKAALERGCTVLDTSSAGLQYICGGKHE